MINKAIIFATNAHAGQYRKATKTPYILHPLECSVIVSQMSLDEEMIAAALLHDTVEDCGVSIETIREEFGDRVAAFVSAESEDKTKTWMERKQATVEHLQTASEEECIVVLGDKLSNIRSLKRDYQICGEELWQRFNQKDKAKIGWYYRSVGEAMQCLGKYKEYQEYISLVEEVFGEL